MRRLWKTMLLFLTLAMLAVLPVQAASSKAPGDIKKLTVKAVSDSSVQLTWSKSAKATSYTVYRVNTETGALKKVGTTSKTTCIVKKLKLDTEYTFQVFASRKIKTKTYKNETGSPTASITLKILTPANVKKFRVGSYGNKSVYLKWNEAKNATGYQIWCYDEETGTYKKIKATEKTYCQIKKLTPGTKYKFKIRSYRKVDGQIKYSEFSDVITAKAKKIDVSSIRGRLFTAYVKYDVKAKVVSTGKKVTLKKGTTIGTEKKVYSGTITAYTTDNKAITVSASALSYGNLFITSTSDYYTKSQKEAFVNTRGYESPTDYLIWINHHSCNVTIFKGSKGEWKQVKSYPCVVGKDTNTGVGLAKILKKGVKYGGHPIIYFTWSNRLYNGNSFHARVDSNTRGAYSGGCVRLQVDALYFIRDYCDIGTTVIRY